MFYAIILYYKIWLLLYKMTKQIKKLQRWKNSKNTLFYFGRVILRYESYLKKENELKIMNLIEVVTFAKYN